MQPDQPLDPPRIYVASLSDYNAGRLHGVWIAAAIGIDAVHAAVAVMLGQSREPGAEEWAIHDYEGFGPLHLDEYISLEHVARIAEGIVEHGIGYAHYASVLGSSAWDELDLYEDRFHGRWDSMREWAEDLLESLGYTVDEFECIPDLIRPYVSIDVQGFAGDMSSDLMTSDGPDGVYVFEL